MNNFINSSFLHQDVEDFWRKKRTYLEIPFFGIDFIKDMTQATHNLSRKIKLNFPVLLFQSQHDQILNENQSQNFLSHLKCPSKQMHILKGSAHMILGESSKFIQNKILNWIKNQLPSSQILRIQKRVTFDVKSDSRVFRKMLLLILALFYLNLTLLLIKKRKVNFRNLFVLPCVFFSRIFRAILRISKNGVQNLIKQYSRELTYYSN